MNKYKNYNLKGKINTPKNIDQKIAPPSPLAR